MPELPEVEVVRAGLAQSLPGRRIVQVRVNHPRPVRRHPGGPQDFATTLKGRTFLEPRRRGKYLWFPFAEGDALIAHLGMSGQFRLDPPGAAASSHDRVEFTFADSGPSLRFVDQRMFGGLWISPGEADLPVEVAHIAADLFDQDIDIARLAAQIRARASGIKRVLLNQEIVSGIGNIYADEALWRARLHYDRPANLISQAKLVELLEAATEVMSDALQAGGTSFDALYVNVNGSSGYFSRSLSVYGREGQPCLRCGRAILREPFMNRSAFRCPSCQPRGRRSTGRG